ncbi:glycoside hydrolase superfamily [Apiosordaria backusii]|uniref:chitinase n=1 Tax=Apiosordaria backusii TaxID=314023 RepID=A0AA40A765_9PEZI|nr:glycoside hydrolase superfamily [Apiosordaria backusii]
MEGKLPDGPQPNADGTCQDRQVEAGDSCATLYGKCGITPSLLTKYNPATNFCANLKVNQWICCSSGSLKDRRPKPNADGSCATYTVKAGESCSVIEAANGMAEGELDTYNKKKTWGWAGCDKLWPNSKICLSSGTPPMPLPVANAVCGPQKPGTCTTLNPCPLNTCCNIWGQFGTTKEFCEITGDGTPGTGTCVSNCGMEIVNNKVPPAEYRKIGYFEAWNPDRDCLWMDATSIDESKFIHIHFAFADVTPDFKVDVSKVQAQFNKFKALKTSKRIVAFGGWAASTSTTTFQIFRDGVNSANRAALANNIANFVKEHGLDGADIDWEYPAAPDLPDIPPADPIDGPNYLAFLRLLRAALPTGETLSIAAPASYWYLKGFPIKDMGSVLDYIVYMTYDLHGQWDAGSKWSQDGCPNGMCLRSHINMTETYNALVMVAKAGVPASKIIVGVSSYGRSFKMKDPNCRGPMCDYTGTSSISHALPGPCTGVQGYISNAEIDEFRKVNDFSVATHYDQATRSNIAIINGTWIAYMDTAEKNARENIYKNWNFGGTSDWAHDLDSFTEIERKLSGPILTSKFTKKGVTGGSTRWYDLSCSMPAVTLVDMERKERWKGVMADEAWADAVKAYSARTTDTGSFSSWIIGRFFFFRGPQDVHCGTTLVANRCQDGQQGCTDKNSKPHDLTVNPPLRTGPAGQFIADSFAKLESAFVNYYAALRGARTDVAEPAPVLEDYFMKEVDDTFSKQLGYNSLAVV